MPEEENHGYGHITSYDIGAETWTLTRLQERKMVVAQQSMDKSLLNITKRDKIPNEVIRSKTKVVDILDKVQCMRG